MFSLLLSILSGVLVTFAYSPFSWWQLSIVAASIMLIVWIKCSPMKAALLGYAFGLAFFASSLYWIYNSLHDYGGSSAFFATIATSLFVALLAFYFMLLGWIVSFYAKGHYRMSLLFFYPSAWVLIEWLRSVLFTGFPWNLLGQAMVDSPFWGILPIFGTFGASWFTVLIATCIVLGISKNYKKVITNTMAVSLVLFLSWGISTIEWTRATADTIKVGIVQSGIPQGIKFDADKVIHNIQEHYRLTDSVLGSNLVIWSETAIPSYYHLLEEKILLPIRDKVIANGGEAFLTGVFSKDTETGKHYNSIISLGDGAEIYHKRHLVPFGEYIPLRSLLNIFSQYIMIPMSDLDAGHNKPILRIGKHHVGVSICYESAFGSEMLDALPEANYLINVSNDSWFGDSIAPHQHLQIARLRAAETARPMIRATSTGISAIINRHGMLIAESQQFVAQAVTGTIQPRYGLTPYAYWKDWPVLILSLLLFVGYLQSLFRKKKLPK